MYTVLYVYLIQVEADVHDHSTLTIVRVAEDHREAGNAAAVLADLQPDQFGIHQGGGSVHTTSVVQQSVPAVHPTHVQPEGSTRGVQQGISVVQQDGLFVETMPRHGDVMGRMIGRQDTLRVRI